MAHLGVPTSEVQTYEPQQRTRLFRVYIESDITCVMYCVGAWSPAVSCHCIFGVQTPGEIAVASSKAGLHEKLEIQGEYT